MGKVTEITKQMDLTDMYKNLLLIQEYTLFSAPHVTFSQIDQILGHRRGLRDVRR